MRSTEWTRWRWLLWTEVLLAVGLGCVTTPPAPVEDPGQVAARLAAYDVSLLDDPVVSVVERAAALERLERSGLEAIAALVARWEAPQDAPFASHRALPRGPVSPDAPGPTTVKVEIEALLYRILAPEGPEPQDALGLIPQAPYVADWGQWWQEHRGESLPELRRWAERARAQVRLQAAAISAAGTSRAPAPRGPLDRRPAASPQARAAFERLRALTGQAVAQGRDACDEARAVAIDYPELDRHVEHACWRMRISRR